MNDAHRWSLALEAHAAEHQALRQRGLARRSIGGGCTTCPDLARIQRNLQTKGSLRGVGALGNARAFYGLGALTPTQKTLATVGVVGAVAGSFFLALYWAHTR